MSSEAWVTLAGLIATVVVIPVFRLLLRIDRRIYSIATNHLVHLYAEMERITGNKQPSLDDLK